MRITRGHAANTRPGHCQARAAPQQDAQTGRSTADCYRARAAETRNSAPGKRGHSASAAALVSGQQRPFLPSRPRRRAGARARRPAAARVARRSRAREQHRMAFRVEHGTLDAAERAAEGFLAYTAAATVCDGWSKLNGICRELALGASAAVSGRTAPGDRAANAAALEKTRSYAAAARTRRCRRAKQTCQRVRVASASMVCCPVPASARAQRRARGASARRCRSRGRRRARAPHTSASRS
jgi:hypothetical protein